MDNLHWMNNESNTMSSVVPRLWFMIPVDPNTPPAGIECLYAAPNSNS